MLVKFCISATAAVFSMSIFLFPLVCGTYLTKNIAVCRVGRHPVDTLRFRILHGGYAEESGASSFRVRWQEAAAVSHDCGC